MADKQIQESRCGRGTESEEDLGLQILLEMKVQPNRLGGTYHKPLCSQEGLSHHVVPNTRILIVKSMRQTDWLEPSDRRDLLSHLIKKAHFEQILQFQKGSM
jgi:hypothetical protein